MEAYTGQDALGVFLSGGSSNPFPSDSLGGLISTKLVRGMSPLFSSPIQGLIIEDAAAANGAGEASVAVEEGVAIYTPPDGLAGDGIAVAEGERKNLTGADTSKTIRVYRVPDLVFSGEAVFELLDRLNGVVSMSDVPDADRVAGSVCYRALFLKALGEVSQLKAWITTTGQSSFALALEEPESDGSIQTISDEETAPADVSWVDAVSLATAVDVGTLLEDETQGLWVRRTFPPSGVVAIQEQVVFHLSFTGG